MTPPRPRAVLVVVAVLLSVLAGCAKDDGPVKPDYTPVPDATLMSRIARLPGVADVDVTFQKSFDYGTGYVGRIRVDPDVDAAAVLDRSYAILRQGRYQVEITVVAVQDGRQVSSAGFGLDAGTTAALDERYGPQPGDGKPPTSGG